MSILDKLPLILDGATGTNLQNSGMPQGACTEQWILEHPDILVNLQREYVKAGSDAIYAPTFSANAPSLKRFGLDGKTEEMNKLLVGLSKQAAGGSAFIGGDISPTGLFLEPIGDTRFEELIEIYKQQAKALYEAGVDFFVIETMLNLAEARAAVIAVKETCNLPVFVTVTVDEHGKTLSGNSALACLIVLQGMGISAFGLNCSTGPEHMLKSLKKIAPYAQIPLIAKPNAGLPQIDESGKLVFSLSAEDFASYALEFYKAGVSILGGCCGTTPLYIEKMAGALRSFAGQGFKQARESEKEDCLITASEKQEFFLEPEFTVPKPIACTLNLADDILSAEDSGLAAINILLQTQDDIEILIQNSYMINLPLIVTTDSLSLLEQAARNYHGKIMFDNSVGGFDMEQLSPIVKKYGVLVL